MPHSTLSAASAITSAQAKLTAEPRNRVLPSARQARGACHSLPLLVVSSVPLGPRAGSYPQQKSRRMQECASKQFVRCCPRKPPAGRRARGGGGRRARRGRAPSDGRGRGRGRCQQGAPPRTNMGARSSLSKCTWVLRCVGCTGRARSAHRRTQKQIGRLRPPAALRHARGRPGGSRCGACVCGHAASAGGPRHTLPKGARCTDPGGPPRKRRPPKALDLGTAPPAPLHWRPVACLTSPRSPQNGMWRRRPRQQWQSTAAGVRKGSAGARGSFQTYLLNLKATFLSAISAAPPGTTRPCTHLAA